MELRKSTRQRLVTLVVALLGIALLYLAFGDVAFAEDAGPPACGGKILEKCTPNPGDTAWMLTSVALVLMMTIPGLGLFYGGMVRKKNVGDTVMTSFAVTCLVTILFAILTYSLAFRAGTPFIGGFDRVFLRDILSDIGKGGIGNPNPLAATIPEAVYICFQMTFAIITPALIAGAFAERMKFSAMLWFIGLWAIFVYAPIAHWVWGPDGFFASGNDAAWVKVLDFAGGTVVHINAGVAGLMCAIMLGKRKETGPAHNMVLTFIGASLLWVGWFGFNAGSAVTAGMQAGMAMLVTQIATAVAAFTWMLVEWSLKGKPTVVGMCSGAVAGLVAITPASGFVGPIGAFVIGIAAGVLCYWGCTGLKGLFSYDDALDCFGVHAVGGIVGALLTGVFAVEQYGGTAGALEGNPGQFINQCIGVGTVLVYDAVVSLIILYVVKLFVGLRVSADMERDGLDLAVHGEVVH
ncbi:ammonia channel protein [Bradyrhizobium sp. NAS80.1]|uniref:ammonium transporter n=1 Tax=Bradyrhizobium sp. NAS80.1 TaxID=1680159 RepID=UPI0009685ED1|nr:ammonium transporter [Bradyrhizobium sp. NAS80.1]OKO81131.1 ammonia channel protein [Bradyrhizobium sp. NAS80.1]